MQPKDRHQHLHDRDQQRDQIPVVWCEQNVGARVDSRPGR